MKEYISNLRVLATFSVILLHTSADFVVKLKEISWENWKVANLIDSATRFSVPVFIMISGAVLLGKDEHLFHFLKKRIRRVIVPFLFWSLIYVLLYNFRWIFRLPPLGMVKVTIIEILEGASFHFWYIFMILGLYLFVPILRKWSIRFDVQETIYFLILWLIACSLFFHPIQAFNRFDLTYFGKFIGYLVLGYYLDKIPLSNKKNTIVVSSILLFAGITITIIGTEILSSQKGEFVSKLYNYLAPNVILSASGIFILFKVLFVKSNKFIRSFDSNSFGIYFVHIIYLRFFLELIPDKSFLPSPYLFGIYILMISLISFIASYTTIILLSLIPRLKKIIT